jgi:hypothetical protein
MKKIALHFLCASMLFFLSAAAHSQLKKPEQLVKFKKEEYDIGKITEGLLVNVDLDFDNISEEPVEIESVMPPCGCTIVERPSGAIARGKSGKIKVQFTAHGTGSFQKNVIIKLVGAARPLVINIRGEVLNE